MNLIITDLTLKKEMALDSLYDSHIVEDHLGVDGVPVPLEPHEESVGPNLAQPTELRSSRRKRKMHRRILVV